MRSSSEPGVWCRHWGVGMAGLPEILNFCAKLSQSPNIPAACADSCLLNGGWDWMFLSLGHYPSIHHPEPRVWSVSWKHKVHGKIPREIKAIASSSLWKTIPKEQKGQKVDANTLWHRREVHRRREEEPGKAKRRGHSWPCLCTGHSGLAQSHDRVWPRWHRAQNSLL